MKKPLHFVKVMAVKGLSIKVCSPIKLHCGLKGNYHAICQYSYNIPLVSSKI